MGQISSGLEGQVEARKHSEDSTDSVSNCDDDGSSLDSSSSVDSSASSVKSDREKNRTGDLEPKNENDIETNSATTTNSSRLILFEPSTPAQWIACFRTCKDDELISILEEGCNVDSNYCDLSPLCAQLRSTAARIREYRALEISLGAQSQPDEVCFYDFRSKNSAMDDNDDLIELCERILKASSRHAPRTKDKKTKAIYTLSLVRQKLVPSKLKEHIFWESLWVILYDRKQARSDKAFFKSIDHSTTHATNTNSSNEQILLQLQTAKDCISEFMLRYQEETKKREQMESIIEKMWETMPKTMNEESKQPKGALTPTPKSSDLPCVKFGRGDSKDAITEEETAVEPKPNCQHTGTWIMSKDSIEFLEFPSEAKEALRTEKQKRLKRVKEEMAFILDSDDPKDSHGQWSCCQKTNYSDTCG